MKKKTAWKLQIDGQEQFFSLMPWSIKLMNKTEKKKKQDINHSAQKSIKDLWLFFCRIFINRNENCRVCDGEEEEQRLNYNSLIEWCYFHVLGWVSRYTPAPIPTPGVYRFLVFWLFRRVGTYPQRNFLMVVCGQSICQYITF